MMRGGARRRVARCAAVVDSEADRPGMRENVAKGDVAADVTVPLIVAPFVATNDTDTPVICVDVTVTTCVLGVPASVHVTDDLPSLSVVVDADESVPPPVTAHA